MLSPLNRCSAHPDLGRQAPGDLFVADVPPAGQEAGADELVEEVLQLLRGLARVSLMDWPVDRMCPSD